MAIIVKDWKHVLKTYSFVFHAVAVLVTLIDIVLPYMSLIQPVFGPTTYGVLMFVLNVAGGVGRFINQTKETIDADVADK